MQLPPADAVVMVAGLAPIRAKKARYFEDGRFMERVLPPPVKPSLPVVPADDWTGAPPIVATQSPPLNGRAESAPVATVELRKTPELAPTSCSPKPETIPFDFGPATSELEDRVKRLQGLQKSQQSVARQANLDPNDGMEI
jgi:type IV secretion system protein VirD4